MISLHPDYTVAEAAHAARILDGRLVQDGQGNVVITPRRAEERHGNGHILKRPRRHGQIVGARLPELPEAV